MTYAELAPAVEKALRATRAHVREAFRAEPGGTEYKQDGSPVTQLDRELEARLADALLPLDDTLGLQSEEGGVLRAGSPTWHLDPLDGTANFARRIAQFGTQVALVEDGKPVFAAIYEPLADVYTWAARGAGTWHEGRRARVSERPRERAVVTVDIAKTGLFGERPELIGTVRRGCYKVRAFGSVALHMRDVAVGSTEAYLGGRRTVSPIHDMAPGALLVGEAGGLVTDGRGVDAMVERRQVVAGAPAIHDWLCALLAAG